MKTGYFARAHEDGHNAKWTQVHIVKDNRVCLCGYRPHKTMQFMLSAYEVVFHYIECKKCLKRLEKIKNV
jgi:hypothetical protein